MRATSQEIFPDVLVRNSEAAAGGWKVVLSLHALSMSQLPVDPSPSETTCDLSVPRLAHAKPLKDRVKE